MKYIPSNKFSNVNVSIRSILPLTEDSITCLNLLLFMVRQKTEKYPSKQSLTQALANNYATRMGTSLTSFGNQLLFDFRFQWIRADWIQSDDYEMKVCDFIDQILNHVILDESGLEEAKFLLSNRLTRQMDDPNTYSILKAFSIIEEDCSLRIPVQGKLEDIEKITLKDVQNVWDIIQKKPKHIYVSGVLSDYMRSFLLGFDCDSEIQSDYSVFNTNQYYDYEEEMDISQTNITLLYQTGVNIQSTDYFPLLVTNSILGQSPNSMLFSEVREKHSYCYSISSSLIRFDGVLCVNTGCNRESIHSVLHEIDCQIERLKSGDFSLEQMDIAKKDVIDGLVSGQDSGFSMIEQEYLDDLLHRPMTIEQRIAAIEAVTNEQVQKAASQFLNFAKVIIKEANNENL